MYNGISHFLAPFTDSMSQTRKSSTVRARCGKRLKRRIRLAAKSTGYVEADFVLSALEDFFAQHRTPAEQIAAVQRSRAAMNAVPVPEDAA